MKNAAKARLGEAVKIGKVSKKCEWKTVAYECHGPRPSLQVGCTGSELAAVTRALLEAAPAREPPRRLGHVRRRAGIAEAHIAAAALGIEIDARAWRRRRCRPASRLVKATLSAVKRADIDIEIEGAVGRARCGRARPWAARSAAAPGSRRRRACWPPARPCRRRRRAPRPGPRSAARCRGSAPAARSAAPGLRHHQPADAPAGHREIFGEAVDDDRLVRVGERRLLGLPYVRP